MSDYQFEDINEINATITTESITGSIFQSLDYLDDGSSVADNYIFEVIQYNNPVGYIKVRLTTESPNNPYDGGEGIVPADGVTEIEAFGLKGIVKPIEDILSNAKEKIIVGKLTNFGIIPSGEESDPIPIFVRNISTGVLLQNKIKLVNKPQLTNTSGSAIIGVNANGNSNPVSALYSITFIGFTPSNQVCQISADGGVPTEKTIVADGETVNDNVISGCSIIFNNSGIVNPADTAEVEISDATDFVEIAKDVNGVPDTIWGLGPIDITQIGGSAIGRIDQDKRARFWMRYSVPESADSDKNPRQFSILATGQVI